ncbi:hypothetical protein [Nocardioides sp.]|uniref:hypothetical protein n=1 Tax=Nocardioides sp. TaxID=35761 RepID=UPI00286D5A15|nr:hypothetical protein [Nocardioides sp.]
MADELPAPDDPCWRRVRPRFEDNELDQAPMTESLLAPLMPYAVWRSRVPYAFAAAVAWFFVFPVLLGGSFGVGVALVSGAVSSWLLLGRRAPLEAEGYAVLALMPVLVVLLLAT